MNKYIPLSVPSFTGNELKYVKECIDTEWVSSAGKYVDLFEKKVAEFTGANFAIACVNGTSALQISLKLAGVEANDEVLIPTITFIAPVNAIAYNNATPVFMDADDHYNLNIEKTMDFIKNETLFKRGFTFNKKTGKKITAIIPVHVWGNAVSLDELIPLCEERNIVVVEDASESLGTIYSDGSYAGKHTGTIGKFGCLSFNGNKIITTGGGGIIITNDKELAEKAIYFTNQAKDDPLRYIHHEIGYNFRLTNIQAALGVAQLEQLKNILDKKREIFHEYKTSFKNSNHFFIADVPQFAENNHWINMLKLNQKTLRKDPFDLLIKLEKIGIQTRPVWTLNHLQKPYVNSQKYKIEKAIDLVNNSLCLPSSVKLDNKDINYIVDSIHSIFN